MELVLKAVCPFEKFTNMFASLQAHRVQLLELLLSKG